MVVRGGVVLRVCRMRGVVGTKVLEERLGVLHHGGTEGTGALHQEGHYLVLYRRRVA